MTNEERLQGNRLIIDFMGVKPMWNGNEYSYTDSPFYFTTEKDLEKIMKNIVEYVKYHSDWNLLHKLIDKIESLEDEIGNNENYKNFDRILSLPIYINITRVWLAAIDFIKWYNTQEK